MVLWLVKRITKSNKLIDKKLKSCLLRINEARMISNM